jgi:hypothetical protein
LKEIVGGSLDVLNERVAMQGLALEGSENHHFKRTGKEVTLFRLFHDLLPVPGYVHQGLEQNSVMRFCRQGIFPGTDGTREGKLGR